jgi:hypothetical protein
VAGYEFETDGVATWRATTERVAPQPVMVPARPSVFAAAPVVRPSEFSFASPARGAARKGSFVLDAAGNVIGVISRRGNFCTVPWQEIEGRVAQVLAKKHRDDALDASRLYARVGATAKLPPRVATAAGAMAVLCDESGTFVSSAVAIDPFGVYLTTNLGAGPLSDKPACILYTDAARRRWRVPAKVHSVDNQRGVALIIAEPNEPVPFVSTGLFPEGSGALYATILDCSSTGATSPAPASATPTAPGALPGFAVQASRGQMTWTVSSVTRRAQLSRIEPSNLGGAAVFDDLGTLYGFAQFELFPNYVDLVLCAADRIWIPKPALAFLTPALSIANVMTPRDLFFHAVGLKDGEKALVRVTVTTTVGARTVVAEPLANNTFVVRALSFSRSPVSWVQVQTELSIAASVVDKQERRWTTAGASQAVMASDNAKTLNELRPVSIALPSPAASSVVAGNGRYLLISCPAAKRVALLDVPGATLRTLTVGSDKTLIAAGAEKFVVCEQDTRRIRRYDLATLALETTVQLPNNIVPFGMVMGSGSAGPVVVTVPGGPFVLDLGTLKAIHINGSDALWASPEASADGRLSVFGNGNDVYTANWSENAVAVSKPVHNDGAYQHPDPAGMRVFTGGRVITLHGDLLVHSDESEESWIPAADVPDFFLGWADRGKPITLHYVEMLQPILTLPPWQEMPDILSSLNGPQPRIRLFAACNRIVLLPSSSNTLILHPIDLRAAMRATGRDFLYVRSVPPRVTHAGRTYRYQIEAVSSDARPTRAALDAGPVGMRVTDAGEVTWNAPLALRGRWNDVVVKVTDAAGNSTPQMFTIFVH